MSVEAIYLDSRDFKRLPITIDYSKQRKLKTPHMFSPIEFGKSIKCTHSVHSYDSKRAVSVESASEREREKEEKRESGREGQRETIHNHIDYFN